MQRNMMPFDDGASSSNNLREIPCEIQPLQTVINRAFDIHNTSIAKIQQIIQQIDNEINQAVKAMQSSQSGTDYASILNILKLRINSLAPQSQMELFNNETEASFNTYLKFLDCLCYTNISKAYMHNKQPEREIINQIVANHLFRYNYFKVGDVFMRVAGVPEAATFRSQYKEMHKILQSLQEHDICPATDWIYHNRGQPELTDLRFEFELYRQHYLEVLKSSANPIEVLNVMRTYITPFDKFYWDEVKSLAGCILWIGQLDESPYADLLLSCTWDKVANHFTEKFLILLGQKFKCPLTSVRDVGTQYLPQQLSCRETIGEQEQWEFITSILFNKTDGSEKCKFHYVFVCQECGEIGTAENPPILLPCGHMICQNSALQLSNDGLILFRCPFCSYLIHFHHCQQLHI